MKLAVVAGRNTPLPHSFPAISAVFDDPDLESAAGLAPATALAQRAGLTDLVAEHLTLTAEGGVAEQRLPDA